MNSLRNLSLLPEPHFAKIDEEIAPDIFHKEVSLIMPHDDQRLITHASHIFSCLKSFTSEYSDYFLSSSGIQKNNQYLKKIKHKNDAYVLVLSRSGIEIYAHNSRGFFYGLQTLRQLIETTQTYRSVTIIDWADVSLRSAYLDLRTVFPKFENILSHIKTLSNYKINTITIEYEDKILFKEMPFLHHKTLGISDEDIKKLKSVCHEYFIDIIPLQQSFGHLEYVLKHSDFQHLREMPDIVGEMCPHKKGAFELASQLLAAMADLHPESPYLHIGCDEVWSLGSCEDCKKSGMTREQSFIAFVNRLIAKVSKLGKTPLLWHDMLCNASQEDINTLDKRAIVCIWIYNGSDLKDKAGKLITMCHKAGLEVIACSAVRSWDFNGDQNYPNIYNRLENIDLWREVSEEFQLSGTIITNWASSFSFSKPYGLFETSFYPLLYASERNWNKEADTKTYLSRFLQNFHGLLKDDISGMVWKNTDYYKALPSLFGKVTKNQSIAKLIVVMRQYEWPSKDHFPMHILLYRGDLYHDRPEEITSLKKKKEILVNQLLEAKKEMNIILDEFLCEEMKNDFIASRFFLEELYQKEADKMIENSLQNH